jgi:hypothetical protein
MDLSPVTICWVEREWHKSDVDCIVLYDRGNEYIGDKKQGGQRMQDDLNQSKQHGRNREDCSVTAEVMYTLINIIDHSKVI